MNPTLLAAVIGALVAGAFISIQAPTNAMLADAAGSPVNAALISFAVGTAVLLVAALALGARPNMGEVRALHWYAWLGGLYGAIFVTVAIFAAPRMGVTYFLIVAVAGQLMTALLLDRMGAFGLDKVEIGPARIAGVLLVLVGALLVRR